MNKLLLSILLLCTSLCFSRAESARQEVMHRDSLLSDFDLFIKYVKATHPDPYTPLGGRPYFSKQSQQMRERIQTEQMTKDQFITMLSDFLSELHDGHSWIRTAVSTLDAEGRIGLYLRAIPNGAVVNITSKPMEKYLGMRLKAVNGVPVEEVVRKAGASEGCENEAGAWAMFCEGGSTYLSTYTSVLPSIRDSITFTVYDMQNTEYNFSLPILSEKQWTAYNSGSSFRSLPHDKRFNVDNLKFRTLDNGKNKVMYMRIASIYGRECFEYMYENGMPGREDNLSYFYDRFMKEQMPADSLKAIQHTPSFSERFADMLSHMKKEDINTLVIDLRNNSGGWTPITLATLYMLYGDEYLTTNMGTCTVRRLSPLYFRKINSTLDVFNRENGTRLRMGDYMFYDDNVEQDTLTDIVQSRNSFISNTMSASRDLLRSLDGKPLYRPAHIYVITDGGTFSAAFHYAFFLSRMGATVVGQTSGQAPNTYMEQTLFKLPYTGIEGQLSNCLQLFLPANDPRAKSFTPDIVFTPEEYASCGWDENAELILLLKRIAEK